jgi:hypothetical protein
LPTQHETRPNLEPLVLLDEQQVEQQRERLLERLEKRLLELLAIQLGEQLVTQVEMQVAIQVQIDVSMQVSTQLRTLLQVLPGELLRILRGTQARLRLGIGFGGCEVAPVSIEGETPPSASG